MKLLSQFNSIESLISAAGKLNRLSGGIKQGFVNGNIDDIFKSLSRGGKQIAPNRVQLPDGTFIIKYPSSTTGVSTIGINKGGQFYKIRIR